MQSSNAQTRESSVQQKETHPGKKWACPKVKGECFSIGWTDTSSGKDAYRSNKSPHTIMKDKTIICFGHVLKNLSYKIQPVLWLILETTLTVEEMFRETRRGVR